MKYEPAIKMRSIGQTKYEYPIPRCKEYWKEVFDEASKNVVKVRKPINKLSYQQHSRHSISLDSMSEISESEVAKSQIEFFKIKELVEPILKISPATPRNDDLSATKMEIVSRKISKPEISVLNTQKLSEKGKTKTERIIEKIYPAKKCPHHKFEPPMRIFDDDIEPFLVLPEKIMMREKKKVDKSKREVKSAGKNEKGRIPKLGTANLQPSFAKPVTESLEYERLSGKLEPLPELISRDSSTRDYSSRLSNNINGKNVETHENKIEVPRSADKIINSGEGNLEEFGIRCSHRALRMSLGERFAKSRNLKRYESYPRIGHHLLGKSSSQDGPSTELNDKKIMVDTETRTISSCTRASSESSFDFSKIPFRNTGSSAEILREIPKLSYPRKTKDRCFCCIRKALEEHEKPQFFSSLEKLAENAFIRNEAVSSFSGSDSSFSLNNEVNRILNSKKHEADLETDEVLGEISFINIESHKESPRTPSDIDISKSHKYHDSPKTNYYLSEESERKRATFKISSASSTEHSRHSTSVGEQTSDDEAAYDFKMANDSGKSRYTAPCFLPVVFRPSLAALRSLRHRKPTTFRAMQEQSIPRGERPGYEDENDDEPDDNSESQTKSRPVTMEALTKRQTIRSPQLDLPKTQPGKSQEAEKQDSNGTIKDQKVGSLTKIKSVPERLVTTGESRKEEVSLKRGLSCSNISDLLQKPESHKTDFNNEEKKKKLESIEEPQNDKDATQLLNDYPEIFSDREISRFLKNRLRDDDSSTDLLDKLWLEFESRLGKGSDDFRASKRKNIVKRLVKLLVDSKRYLHPDKFPSNLTFTSPQQSALYNSRRLRRSIGVDAFSTVAPLIGMREWYKKKFSAKKSVTLGDATSEASSGTSAWDLEVQPGSLRSISTEKDEDEEYMLRLNPYSLFLKKQRRQVVGWRELTEADTKGYDPDSTLKMRAERVTDRICKEFCNWVKTIGGEEELNIDEEVLKDMFEIDFSPEIGRTMQVSVKQMPMVPREVARTMRCPDADELAMTRKHLFEDAKLEMLPKNQTGFGSTLPESLRFVPPRNRVQKLWLHCKNVPLELEKMDTVWKNITHLDSVRSFLEWLDHHEDIPLPEALTYERIAEEEQTRKHSDAPVDTFEHMALDLHQITSLKVGQ